MWVSLITLVFVSNLTYAKESDVMCLAKNIYYEAGAEIYSGKLAVAQVVMNRVDHPKFPKTVCGVIHQRTATTCQFSWICDKPKSIDKQSKNWQESVKVAKLFLTNDYSYDTLDDDVLFFHTVSSPYTWVKHYQKVTTIGNHIFYRPKRKTTV